MVVELAIGAVGLIAVVYPGIEALHNKIWKVIGDLIKTNRAAKDPEVLRQLREELRTWDELRKSIDRVKGSDDPEDRVLSAARSHCKEYERALRKTLDYLKQFRDTEDKKEMADIIVELGDQFKLVRRHRRSLQKWIGNINMCVFQFNDCSLETAMLTLVFSQDHCQSHPRRAQPPAQGQFRGPPGTVTNPREHP